MRQAMTERFTRADYALLPEGFPAQLVRGELVKEPAPTYGHQCVLSLLHAALVRLVDPRLVLPAPADVEIGEHDVYQPDLVVLRRAPPWGRSDVGIPLLAVEVLSPTSARRDRNVKAGMLLQAGVEEVWLVDPVAATVEVRRREGTWHAEGDEPIASEAVRGFSVVPSHLLSPPDT
jgi:Uma2 family endonuclease